ncbi:hypothetical protein D9M69_383790 [compost metagenome]
MLAEGAGFDGEAGEMKERQRLTIDGEVGITEHLQLSMIEVPVSDVPARVSIDVDPLEHRRHEIHPFLIDEQVAWKVDHTLLVQLGLPPAG